MIQGNTQPDRWGLRGREDLGGGPAAIFQLENGFYTNTGAFATANTLWNRAAYVGGLEPLRHHHAGPPDAAAVRLVDPLSTAYGDELVRLPPRQHRRAGRHRQRALQQRDQAEVAELGRLHGRRDAGAGQHHQFRHGPLDRLHAQLRERLFKAAVVYSNEHDRSLLVSQAGIAISGQNTANGYTASKVENFGAGASYAFGDWLVHAPTRA